MDNKYKRNKINVVKINEKEYILLKDLRKNNNYKDKILIYKWIDRKDLNEYLRLCSKLNKEGI